MTNNELILRNILLDNVADITNLQAKALAEVLMMRVYYKQASSTFLLKQRVLEPTLQMMKKNEIKHYKHF